MFKSYAHFLTKKSEDDKIKRKLKLALVLAVLATAPVATASSSNSAYNVHVTSKYVHANAKCSCGASSGGYDTYHNGTFLNYCPNCHRYGTLSYSKYCAEGQWTCSNCDSDYCMGDGKEKMSNSDVYLSRYAIPKAVISQNNTGQVEQKPSLLDVIKSKLSLNLLINF